MQVTLLFCTLTLHVSPIAWTRESAIIDIQTVGSSLASNASIVELLHDTQQCKGTCRSSRRGHLIPTAACGSLRHAAAAFSIAYNGDSIGGWQPHLNIEVVLNQVHCALQYLTSLGRDELCQGACIESRAPKSQTPVHAVGRQLQSLHAPQRDVPVAYMHCALPAHAGTP